MAVGALVTIGGGAMVEVRWGGGGDVAMTRAETWLRGVVAAWATTFASEAALYGWWAWKGPSRSRGFAVNSIAKDLTFLAMALMIMRDSRRGAHLVWLLVLGHTIIFVCLVVLWATGRAETNFPGIPMPPSYDPDPNKCRLKLWTIFNPLVPVSLAWLQIRATRSRRALPDAGSSRSDLTAPAMRAR